MKPVDLSNFTKSLFANQAAQNQNVNLVPPDVKCVVVSDFFKEDLVGGAELTLDAILAKANVKFARVRSQELTADLIKKNLNKYWIVGNFAGVQPGVIEAFIGLPVHYSVIEFDFKYCVFRSPFKHFMEKGVGCDCQVSSHGQIVKTFYMKADRVFWMAEKQRDQYLDLFPELNIPNKHVVQSSTFSDETLGKLSLLRNIFKNSDEKKDKVWAVQVSNSWIKGTNETIQWCKSQGMNIKPIGNMSYEQFLVEMAKSYGLVFKPLDSDTCPRVVIEAKLAGCELALNTNVLHMDETWFKGTIEETEAYLRTRGTHFWDVVGPLVAEVK